jgi:hypothetical protein
VLESVRVRGSRDQWLIIVNDNTPLPPELQSAAPAIVQTSTPVNGRIFAFSRKDGSPLWQSPAVVRGYWIPNEQPDDLPTLWMVRQYGQAPRNSTQSNRTDVLCLDRRTGAALLDRPGVSSVTTSQLQVNVDPKKREITLILAQVSLTVQFTEEPRPPEPPIQHSYPSRDGLGAAILEEWDAIVSTMAESLRRAKPPAANPPAK